MLTTTCNHTEPPWYGPVCQVVWEGGAVRLLPIPIDGGRADVQYPRRIANPTGVHGHVDDLALHLRRLSGVGIVQQKRTTRTALLSTTVPLLALPGLAMADNISALTVGTVQNLENHHVTRMCWGFSASIRSQRIADQHLCDTFVS